MYSPLPIKLFGIPLFIYVQLGNPSVADRKLRGQEMQVQVNNYRLAPVLKIIFHQCVIYTCSQSNSDGSVLKQSHQS